MMQHRYTKPALTALWILAAIAAAFTGGMTSTSNWIVLAAIALVPPTVLWQFWAVPAPSMSESIRKAQRP